MKDKNGHLIWKGDWVLYTRPYLWGETITEIGQVFECHFDRIYMTIRGGCFCGQIERDIEIVNEETAMVWKLAE